MDSGGSGTSSSSNRLQFSIPDVLQIYRQTLFLAVKEADQSAAGNPYGEDGLAEMRKDLDNWNQIEFDPPGCLRLSKKSGACQKIVSYWKKLLGSVLTDRDPASFGNHDRGVMTICKLLHKDFQVAETAIVKWNDRDFPNIPADQAKEKLSMNQLTFLCRRYHNDLTLIAHAFKSSIATNDFKFLNPRSTETYPIDSSEIEVKDEDINPAPIPVKAEKRKRSSGNKDHSNDKFLSMASMYEKPDLEPKFPRFQEGSPMPSPLDPSTSFFSSSPPEKKRPAPADNHSILKTLLPRSSDSRSTTSDQPLNLGLGSHAKANGNNQISGNGTSKLRAKGDISDDYTVELTKLREKNKKYVGMILTLVQQLVASGQVPFVDLRNIDPEDREESNRPTESKPVSSPIIPESNPIPRSLQYPPSSNQHSPAPRRKAAKFNPSVTFDRTSMSWNVAAPATNASRNQEKNGQLNKRIPEPVHPQRPTLASLLNEPSPKTCDFPTGSSYDNSGSNSQVSSKSKRKNNPMKRELPGYAPRAPASPDVGIGSDETGSVGSGEHQRSVKSTSLFVPPVEKNYVESRISGGRWDPKSPAEFDDALLHSSLPRQNGSGRRKCSLQSMADSLLLANGGLAAMGMKTSPWKAGPEEKRTSRFSPGTAVFGKLRDGNKYPGEVVERLDNSYVIAWLHANYTSNIAAEDIFSVDETLAPLKEVMVRTDDDYQHCALIETHRNRTYTVLNPYGQLKKCDLSDLVIPAIGLFQDKPNGAVGSHGDAAAMDTYDSEHPSPESSTDLRNSNLECSIRDEFLQPFRNTCFMLTWQKTNLFKGYEDNELIELIQAAGGTVVRTFEDLIEAQHGKFLIAPCTCSTTKFFQCLAANIPCVSYQWIVDCCSAKEKLDHVPYILPAGIIDDNVVLWLPRNFMFGNRRIGLYSESADFCNTWLLPLTAGGNSVYAIDLDNVASDMTSLDLVIVDRTCPDSVKKIADDAGVIIVNETWLKHSLVHGRMQPFDDAQYAPITDQ